MRRIIPVIHVQNHKQALENAHIVYDHTDWLFLIDHSHNTKYLTNTADLIRQTYPTKWIGVNSLDLRAQDAVNWWDSIDFSVDAIWTDDYISSRLRDVKGREIFGGFSFKYKHPQLPEEAELASQYVSTLVTSGDGTGLAADIDKVKNIKKYTKSRLGLASGVTIENISDYPEVDDFLVATHISKDFYNIDESKLKQILNRLYEK